MTKYHFDILIVGTGLAGLFSALSAAKWSKVAIVTKSKLEKSNTYWAQGGIAAAIQKEDSPEYHFNDTTKTGRGLCDNEAVNILVNEGVDRARELIELGMEFDSENGELALGLEGGHSKRRVLHAGGDATGIRLVNFLIDEALKNKNITVFENTFVYKLISAEQSCYGAYAYDFTNKEDISFFSNATIIASGGASGIFRRTTNPHTSTGDGIALAYNAGAQIADMEFIQFHPSAFYSDTGKTFLISEAVRGEGAHLYNHAGVRFMPGYHENAELAPRDVVAKAIFNEMKISSKPNVFLKLDHLDEGYIKKRFSHITQKVQEFGLDISKDPIPIAPAAHYMIGGIRTGHEAQTNIKRLFACGEVALTGVHGANRLASNSLLECVVFGKRAADSAQSLEKEYIDSSKFAEPREFKINSSREEDLTNIINTISDLMTSGAGIIRNGISLLRTREAIAEVILDFEFTDYEYYSTKLRSLVCVCNAIINSALEREESRGSHIREDYPEQNDNMQFRIIQQINEENIKVNIEYK